MSPSAPEPKYQLSYWPLPFRGCFISYLFAYRDVPLLEQTDFAEIDALRRTNVKDQSVPFMGPPVLRELATDRALSQMPAIVLYVSRELELLPDDPFEMAMAMKVLMDCNDVLMEICRYNGSSVWCREEWIEFRTKRLPHWLRIFAESLTRGFIGNERVTFADIGIVALFGNMMRCLPELEPDVIAAAPKIHLLCSQISAKPSLAEFIKSEDERYGKLYCGGQIEASIRAMLEQDSRVA